MEHVLSATLELNDKFTTRINNSQLALKKFEANAKNIKNVLNNSFDTVTSKFDNAFDKLAKNRQNIARGLNTGVNVALGGGAAAGVFLKNSFDKYANLQEILSRNGAITGANIEQQKELATQVRNLGKNTRYSALEVAQAQQYQAMAGYKTNEILALTPKLLKFASASGSDLARSSDILTDNLDAFGLKLTQVDELMDVMAATANNSNTNISMLGEAYQYVASSSRGFDNFKEVNVMLGILANNGIKGAKAGRNLAGMYINLAKPSKEMREAFNKLGVSIYDSNKKFKGLRTIIQEAKPKLDKMNDAQKNLLITTIAGAEGLKIWNSIMNYSNEGTKKITDSVYNSAGAIEKQNEIMSKTPQAKVAELKSAFEELQLAIGEGVAPVAIELMDDLKRKISEVTSSETFKKDNIIDFFQTLKSNATIAISVLGGFKAAAIAAAHPYLIAISAGAVAGYKFGNWLFNKTDWGKKVQQGALDRWNKKEAKKLHDWKQNKDFNRMKYEMDFGKEGLQKADSTIYKTLAVGSPTLNNFENEIIKNYNNVSNNTRQNYTAKNNEIIKNYNNVLNNTHQNYTAKNNEIIKNYNNVLNNTHQNYTAKNFNSTNLTKMLDAPQISKKADITLNVNVGGVIKDKTQDVDEIVNKATQQFKDSLKAELQNAVATQ